MRLVVRPIAVSALSLTLHQLRFRNRRASENEARLPAVGRCVGFIDGAAVGPRLEGCEAPTVGGTVCSSLSDNVGYSEMSVTGVGANVGPSVGCDEVVAAVGSADDDSVEIAVGAMVGQGNGSSISLGLGDGCTVALIVGTRLAAAVGAIENGGRAVGVSLGRDDGDTVGFIVGFVEGSAVGSFVGVAVGRSVGFALGVTLNVKVRRKVE